MPNEIIEKYLEIFTTQAKHDNTLNIITLVSVLVTLSIGIINALISKSKLKIEGITQHRVEWIQEVRNLSAKILSFRPSSDLSSNESIKLLENLRENAYHLELHLNIMGAFDYVICDFLANYIKNVELLFNNAEPNKTSKDIQNYKRLLDLSVRIYLKAEWKRVNWDNRFFKWGINKRYNEQLAIKGILDAFDCSHSYIKDIRAKYEEELHKSNKTPRLFTELVFFEMQPCKIILDSKCNAEVITANPSDKNRDK